MKKIIFAIFSVVLLIFAGCTDNVTSVNQPSSSNKHILKIIGKDGLNLGLLTSKSKNIIGELGGSIIYTGRNHSENNPISFFAYLTFPKNAFIGRTDFTITMDEQNASVVFTPHMIFNRPLNLDLKFTGLDLSSLDLTKGNVEFYYVDDEGNFTPVANSGIFVNASTGTLGVINAKINHFSRYAFAQ
ncbi:MAG: hypothetical protein M1480_02385 [Bacteroidetes bacterium]|nr:hypothetical protein [Bacteroidota bacterium]